MNKIILFLFLGLVGMLLGCGPKASKVTDAEKMENAVNLFMAEHPNPGIAGGHQGVVDEGCGIPFSKGDPDGDGCVTIADWYIAWNTIWHKTGVPFSPALDIHCDSILNDLDVYYFALYNGGEFSSEAPPIECQ